MDLKTQISSLSSWYYLLLLLLFFTWTTTLVMNHTYLIFSVKRYTDW